ncbi:conserved Plasmodium protein, unknown function [Plasmodium relictum]|uniref:Uncharacterized protein n=1 Tax=Plasmodium relictum TaxID=85471 RepID=A0A1J1H2Q9_PLARL|nr:conserved Plasmodium protein, unknown function [Plasmodium relictum]CRG98831.1 conserved Plasmodium protein, unknown function [Plasmodium relictum]
MLQYMRERKKYGNNIPKSLSSKINKSKLIQKNICSNYKTIKIIDTYENMPSNQLNNERTKIKEIILAHEVIVVLLNSGISRAYDIGTGIFLCDINPTNFSIVHTIVYNSYNNTLIVAYASFPAHLQCKVIDCNDLKNGKTNSSQLGTLFEKVVLSHPAFFEFCETNGRIGAANLNTNSYTFWDMTTYHPVFEIEEEFQEIRVSDGLVAMFKQPMDNTIPLSLFDIENGKRLVETVISILPRREMQFLELLVSKLLIKQEGSSLRIYDLLKKTRQKVKNTYAFQPAAFVFYDHPSPINGKVYNNDISKKFFTISNDLIEFWELDSFMLKKMYAIHVPGLRDPDLCNHSLMTEILCLYSSNAFDKIKKYENLFKYVDYVNSKNEICDNLNEEDANILYKKKLLNNNIQDNKLKFDLNKENFNFGALLFFSLNDGEFLNYISENICGHSVEVLASNTSMTTIVCGDNKGFIRILRNNPKFDDFEIKSVESVNNLDKNYYKNLFLPKGINIEDNEKKLHQIKRKTYSEKENELLKKSKTDE